MSVWQARQGESKPCSVFQEVLSVWWTRTRARPGEKVKAGAIVKDVKDGKKVDFTIVCGEDTVGTVSGTLSGGKVEAEWTIELPEKAWPPSVTVVVDCVVDSKIRSRRSQRPELHVDTGMPVFSL
jgi:hypothetical protein